MSLLLFIILVIAFLIALWVLYQLAAAVVLLTWLVAWVTKSLFKLFGKVAFYDGRPQEIIGPPLTEEFKQNASGKLAPDMWTDGRRLFFELDGKSYSVPADLEAARKRKNELIAERSIQNRKS